MNAFLFGLLGYSTIIVDRKHMIEISYLVMA